MKPSRSATQAFTGAVMRSWRLGRRISHMLAPSEETRDPRITDARFWYVKAKGQSALSGHASAMVAHNPAAALHVEFHQSETHTPLNRGCQTLPGSS